VLSGCFVVSIHRLSSTGWDCILTSRLSPFAFRQSSTVVDRNKSVLLGTGTDHKKVFLASVSGLLDIVQPTTCSPYLLTFLVAGELPKVNRGVRQKVQHTINLFFSAYDLQSNLGESTQ
jgi:hypothetical protein